MCDKMNLDAWNKLTDRMNPFPKVRKYMDTLKLADSYTTSDVHQPVLLRKRDRQLPDEKYETVSEHFRKMCRKYEDNIALAYESREDDSDSPKLCTLTYEEFDHLVDRAAAMLLNFGLAERGIAAIIAWNCHKWLIAELAIMRVGGVAIGIYPTTSLESIYDILTITEATIVFVEDKRQLQRIRSIKARLPKIRAVIHFDHNAEEVYGRKGGDYYNWCYYVSDSHIANKVLRAYKTKVEKRESEVAANECALIVFSCGDDAGPRYVMLSHDNILRSVKSFKRLFRDLNSGKEIVHSYLPLTHIAAQIFEIFLPIDVGATVYFSRFKSLNNALRTLLLKIKPTMFFGAPRTFEALRTKHLMAEKDTNIITYKILQYTRSFLLQYNLDRMRDKPSSLLNDLKYRFASKVLEKINPTVGLEKCSYIFIGGRLSTDELKTFFLSMNMRLIEVYGLSETGGGIAYNKEFKCTNTVGQMVHYMEVKIHKPNSRGEGEIYLRGRRVCMGYFKAPEATSANIDSDGWVHTGDWGYLDTLDNLYINGRVKNVLTTASGDSVVLDYLVCSIIEQLPCLGHIVIVGDNRRYLTALMTFATYTHKVTHEPQDEFLPEAIDCLKSIGITVTRPSQIINDQGGNYKQILIETIQDVLEAISCRTVNPHRILKFTIMAKGFSVPNGELERVGALDVVKRSVVLSKYADVIDAMYKPGFCNKFLVESTKPAQTITTTRSLPTLRS